MADFARLSQRVQPRINWQRNRLPGEVFAFAATRFPRGVPLGDGPTWATYGDLRGLAVLATNNLDGWSISNVPGLPLSSTTDYTFELIGYWISQGTFDAANAFYIGNTPRVGTPYRGFGRTQGVIRMAGQDGFSNAAGGPSVPSNVWVHAFARKTASGITYWVRRFDTSAVATSLVSLPSQYDLAAHPNVTLIQSPTGVAWSGAVAKVGIYNYGLEDAQIQRLLDQPWLNFQPRRALTYSLPSAAVFNPAWAAGSNRYIGGGVHVS